MVVVWWWSKMMEAVLAPSGLAEVMRIVTMDVSQALSLYNIKGKSEGPRGSGKVGVGQDAHHGGTLWRPLLEV